MIYDLLAAVTALCLELLHEREIEVELMCGILCFVLFGSDLLDSADENLLIEQLGMYKV